MPDQRDHQEIDHAIGHAVARRIGYAGLQIAQCIPAGQAGAGKHQYKGSRKRNDHELMRIRIAQRALLHVLHDGAEAVSDERDHDAEEPFEGEFFLAARLEIHQHDGGEQQHDADDDGGRRRFALHQTVDGREDERAGDDEGGKRHGAEAQRKDGARPCRGIAEGKANVTAAIEDVSCTVPVTVYTISSNIEDEDDKNHVTDSAGDIIDDIVNNENPDLSDTDIPEEDLGNIRDEIQEGLERGDEFFTDMKWYEEHFVKYKNNWGQIQKAARELNAQFAGAYNIEVEMYHKKDDGATHKIGCIEEFENEITFAFDLPTGMSEIQSGYARKYVLVRIHRNEIEAIDMEVKNGKVTAESNGFSDFILLYVDEKTESGVEIKPVADNVMSAAIDTSAMKAEEVEKFYESVLDPKDADQDVDIPRSKRTEQKGNY